MVRNLALSRGVGPHQYMILKAKVKVTRIFGSKKLVNLAMLGPKTLKVRRDVSPHKKVDDTKDKGHGQGHHDLQY